MAKGRILISGPQVEAKAKFAADFPVPPRGEHLWMMMAMFRIADPKAERFHLDFENLLTIEGPGCYVCEQTLREAGGRPCPGDPTGRLPRRDRG